MVILVFSLAIMCCPVGARVALMDLSCSCTVSMFSLKQRSAQRRHDFSIQASIERSKQEHEASMPLTSTSTSQAVPVAEVQKLPGNEHPHDDGKESVFNKIFGAQQIGFTKENERFVSRVAMLGFAASMIGEAITGQGTLAQFHFETGIPIYEAEPLLLFFILFTLIEGLKGIRDRSRFLSLDMLWKGARRPKGGCLRSQLGLQAEGPLFGFTKANELFVGRLAMLGFGASLVGETISGQGTLSQLNFETGLPVTEIEPLFILSIMFFFLSAIDPDTGVFFVDKESKK